MDINAVKKGEEVVESLNLYLKGKRSITLTGYNLFTRRHQNGETFEDSHCELRRLYELAEAERMIGDDLSTV